MSHAGEKLDERLLDADTIEAATVHYARARERQDVALSSVFVFRLGAEWLGFPTAMLDRVAAPTVVHSLPHRRGSAVAGLVNVGGDLVVHVSLAGLLGIPADVAVGAADASRRIAPRLVVLADARGRLAITVDEVWGVHHYDPALLRAAPPTLSRAPTTFTTAMLEVDGRMVGCLDGARVMDALSVAIA